MIMSAERSILRSITERLAETIYDGEYSLDYSTEQYDYKRGRCDISTEVQVRISDIFNADAATTGRFRILMPTFLFRFLRFP